VSPVTPAFARSPSPPPAPPKLPPSTAAPRYRLPAPAVWCCTPDSRLPTPPPRSPGAAVRLVSEVLIVSVAAADCASALATVNTDNLRTRYRDQAAARGANVVVTSVSVECTQNTFAPGGGRRAQLDPPELTFIVDSETPDDLSGGLGGDSLDGSVISAEFQFLSASARVTLSSTFRACWRWLGLSPRRGVAVACRVACALGDSAVQPGTPLLCPWCPLPCAAVPRCVPSRGVRRTERCVKEYMTPLPTLAPRCPPPLDCNPACGGNCVGPGFFQCTECPAGSENVGGACLRTQPRLLATAQGFSNLLYVDPTQVRRRCAATHEVPCCGHGSQVQSALCLSLHPCRHHAPFHHRRHRYDSRSPQHISTVSPGPRFSPPLSSVPSVLYPSPPLPIAHARPPRCPSRPC
jgi:hypothetical protein